MSQKASSFSLRYLFCCDKHSKREKSKGTKHGDSQDGTAVASPIVPTTPFKSAARSSTAGIDASRHAQSSPFPAGTELRYPKQFASSPGPSGSSVQQPATKLPADISAAGSAPQTAQAGSASYDANAVLTAEAVEPPAIDNHSSSGSPAFPRTEYTRANPQSQPRDVTSHQTSDDENMKFWDEAYDKLKEQDPELIRAYEKILSRYEPGTDVRGTEENLIEQTDRAKRHTQMHSILKKVLDKTTKPNSVGKKIEDAIDVVLSLKDAIGFGLQPVPIAALAWAGACIGLQVSYHPTVLTTYLRP